MRDLTRVRDKKPEVRSQKDLVEQHMTEPLTASAGFNVTSIQQGRNREILAPGFWLLASLSLLLASAFTGT